MNHYDDLLSSWEKLEDEFPLNIPDLLMAVLERVDLSLQQVWECCNE